MDRQNPRRIKAAKETLQLFAAAYGELDGSGKVGKLAQQNITDLLSDLAHYCESVGLSFSDCVRAAERHHSFETLRFLLPLSR